MKKYSFILFGSLLLLTVLSFISCDGFMKGADVKEELERIIEYENSQKYTIKVDSEKGSGVIKSPAGGVAQKKVTDTFDLIFEATADYEFIEWKILDAKTKKEYKNGQYLTLGAMDKDETTCTFNEKPADGVELVLYAVVTKRPRIISATPTWNSEGAYRDSRIQVMFNHDMDPDSIYFSKEEKQEIKQQYKLDDSAFLPENSEKKYGYVLEGVQYYKNISINNYMSDQSVLNYFGEPFFDDPRTLIIPASDSANVSAGTQILVSIGKDFSCISQEKNISLKEDYTWVYWVNTKTDTEPPAFGENSPAIKHTDDSDLSADATAPTLLNKGTLKLDVRILDNGSGPYGFFTLKMAGKDDSGEYTNNFQVKIPYLTLDTINGAYTDNFVLPDYITDGDYKISEIIISDKNGRTKETDLNYYISVDRTAPVITSYNVSLPPVALNASSAGLIFSFNISHNDIEKILVKKRNQGSQTAWKDINSTTCTDFTGNQFKIAGAHGNIFEINIEFIDKAGNSCIIDDNKGYMTRPKSVSSLTVDFADSNCSSIKVHWTCPTTDYYSGVIIRAKNDTFNKFTFEDPNRTGECTTSKIRFYGSNRTIQVIAFTKYENVTYESVPIEATIKGPVIFDSNSTASSIKISDFIKNQYYVVSYRVSSGNSEYTSCPGFTAESTTYVITGLGPGTTYDVKVEEYNSASDPNPAFTYSLAGTTKPAVPENLKATTMLLTSPTTRPKIELTWNRPQGNFTGYAGSIGEWKWDDKLNQNQFNGSIASFSENDPSTTTHQIYQMKTDNYLKQGWPYIIQLWTKQSSLTSDSAIVYVCTPYTIIKEKNKGYKISYTIGTNSAFSKTANYTEMTLYYGSTAEAAMDPANTNKTLICSGAGVSGPYSVTVQSSALSATGGENTCFAIKVILKMNKNKTTGEYEIESESWWPVP